MLVAVIMKYKGLVDPKDKPFGRVFPFEVQVKIMFWVEYLYTMDKQKKLLREFKGLPKCDVTACHNTSDRISGGTKWCFAYIRPEQPTVITVTEYSITSYP